MGEYFAFINGRSKSCVPQAYWVNTGKNEILDDVLKVATDDITERLHALLQGENVVEFIIITIHNGIHI